MPYIPFGPPTARAHRRAGDLQAQKRRRRGQVLRKDRRRVAFHTMRQRLRIVREYRARQRAGAPEHVAATQAAAYGQVSPRSVRRFDHALRAGGKRALIPRYRVRTPAVPPHAWAVISTVLALRARLGWCGQRIAAELAARGIATLSHMSVYRLLRRYHARIGVYHPVGRRHGIRYGPQTVRAPNWAWHVDFAGPLVDPDGVSRSLLVVIDSFSRMLLALDVVPDQTAATAERVFAALFARYGCPRVLISDNGRAFAPPLPGQDHRFQRFLSAHGVEHRRSRPYYPQTNGKAEAMVKTVKRELLGVLCRVSADQRWRWSEVTAQRASFIGWYNFYRAHGALGYGVPASRYAGVSLPKPGLSSLFGLGVVGSEMELSAVPHITQATRTTKLALVPV